MCSEDYDIDPERQNEFQSSVSKETWRHLNSSFSSEREGIFPMQDNIIQFPGSRSNHDHAEQLAVRTAYNQMAVEIMSIAILDGDAILENDTAPAEYNYQAPTDDPA